MQAMRPVLQRRSRKSPSHPDATDRGVSLVEVLVAVVLLGIGGAAVMTSLGASIRGSSTHEDKVEALAALETAASMLQHKAEPCTPASYRSLATSAITDPTWASSLTVTNLSCGADVDQLRLGVTSPRGLVQTLDVVIGGPRVADTPGGGELDDTTLPIVSCALVSLTVDPATMELSDSSLLTGDLRIEARTTETCSGSLRAVFDPAPIDPATGLEWRPSFQEIDDRRYELILTEGTFAWETGPVDTQIENRLPNESFVNLGTASDLFATTCRSISSVDVGSPVRDVDGRLLDPLTITVELSPACPSPATMTLRLETGSGSFEATLVPSGQTWIGTVPGQADSGPVFSAGTKSITIEAPFPIEPVTIEVQ